MNPHPPSRLALFALASALILGACTGGQRGLLYVRDHGHRAYSRGDYETALADFSEYTERNPGDPEGHLALAKSLLATGQPSRAVEHASIAFDQLPANAEAFDTLAQALFEARRNEQLFTLLRDRAAQAGRPADYIRLGHYAARAGDPDAAEQALLTAARLDRGQTPAPQVALADFYETIGDRAEAMRRLRMALFLDAANPDLHQRIRAMGEIPGPSLAIQPIESY